MGKEQCAQAVCLCLWERYVFRNIKSLLVFLLLGTHSYRFSLKRFVSSSCFTFCCWFWFLSDISRLFKLTRTHVLLCQLLVKSANGPTCKHPWLKIWSFCCAHRLTHFSHVRHHFTPLRALWLCWGQGGWRVKLVSVNCFRSWGFKHSKAVHFFFLILF